MVPIGMVVDDVDEDRLIDVVPIDCIAENVVITDVPCPVADLQIQDQQTDNLFTIEQEGKEDDQEMIRQNIEVEQKEDLQENPYIVFNESARNRGRHIFAFSGSILRQSQSQKQSEAS